MLVAYEGFDHYNLASSTDILNRRGGGLQWNTGAVSWVTPGRHGGSAMGVGQNSAVLGTLTVPLASGYIGFAARIVNVNYPANPYIYLYDEHGPGNVAQFTLVFNQSTGGIDVYSGRYVSLIASTTNNAFTVNAWNFIEFSFVCSTTGSLEIRSNGQIVLSATPINLRASAAHAWVEGIEFHGPGAPTGTQFQIDDLYVCDSTRGSGLFTMDYFLGDVRVQTLHPIANYGTPSWTPLAATNWQEVDEPNADGDATYNSTATVGATDRFSFEAMSETVSNVLAVQVTGAYRKDDAGTRLVSQLLNSAGAEVTGAAYSIPQTYVYCCDLYTTDPATGAAWAVAAVNTLRAGYVLTG